MTRLEKDTMGCISIPDEVYYGPQTARALKNFRVSRDRFPQSFIKAQAAIKIASAKANINTKKLDPDIGNTIIQAAFEIREGKLNDQFILDVFQAGAGTSQNMNINEVIANRALEIKGYEKGRYDIIHPNDHVNMSQSSNDTIHTAIHVSAIETMTLDLLPAVSDLQEILLQKSEEFINLVKPGRTHLQDAVPITFGQELSGYTRMVELDLKRINLAMEDFKELNMGGTATGTGLNAPDGFTVAAVDEISDITGIRFKPAANLFEATQSADTILNASAAFRNLAVSLIKIANDLRLLSSGPRTGFGEINLPQVQPGSSIMPGKVNPVMAEMLNMACFQVIGNDTAVMMAAQGGQLELNVFTPVLAHNILKSIEILTGAICSFNERCLRSITVNEENCSRLAESSLALVTALAPEIGYEKAAEIAQKAYRENISIKKTVIEAGLLSERDASRILDPLKLTGLTDKNNP